MKRNLHILSSGIIALFFWQAGFAIEAGAPLPVVSLDDQFGNSHSLDAGVKRIYSYRDRAGDALLKSTLGGDGQALLDAQQAVVIADTSAIPGFVRRFALSGLKQRPYTAWLDPEGATARLFPSREDNVTVIDLDQLRIVQTRFIGEAATLRGLLEQSADGE